MVAIPRLSSQALQQAQCLLFVVASVIRAECLSSMVPEGWWDGEGAILWPQIPPSVGIGATKATHANVKWGRPCSIRLSLPLYPIAPMLPDW